MEGGPEFEIIGQESEPASLNATMDTIDLIGDGNTGDNLMGGDSTNDLMGGGSNDYGLDDNVRNSVFSFFLPSFPSSPTPPSFLGSSSFFFKKTLQNVP